MGTRSPSPEGAKRARRIAHALASRGVTVASGLARGIDTGALTGALDAGAKVIAVIDTPLGVIYPKENRTLQERIAADHLLVGAKIDPAALGAVAQLGYYLVQPFEDHPALYWRLYVRSMASPPPPTGSGR